MHVNTSTHILSLAEDGIYNLRKIGVTGDDSWLDTRRGEAYDRHFQVNLKDNQLVLQFEEKNIGTVGINNQVQVQNLIDLVEYWNKTIGPTDLNTLRTVELVKDWHQLLVKKQLTLKCITYNCAGLLGYTSLKSEIWVKLFGDISKARQNDIVVLSFQETDNLNRSVKSNPATLQTTSEMSRAYLHQTHSLISCVQLLGIMTLVFLANPLVPFMSKLRTDKTSTGFLRMWGNKGAVLTRFNLFSDAIIGGGVEVSVVNAHLSAGEGITQLGRRRWELREIGQAFSIFGLTGPLGESADPDNERDANDTDSISSVSSSDREDFEDDTTALDPPPLVAKSRSSSSGSTAQETITEAIIGGQPPDRQDVGMPSEDGVFTDGSVSEDTGDSSNQTDDQLNSRPKKITVFMGDLNYRILLSKTEAQQKVKAKDWVALLAYDSLSIERHRETVFHGFEEAAIHFPPTYKYVTKSTEFAPRVPSYTDRIMFRSSCNPQIISYNSLPELTYSDHRPVLLRVSFEVPNCINSEKWQDTMSRALKLADEAEKNARPKVEVSDNGVYTISGPPLSIQRYPITLRNLGSRPIHWVVKDAHAEADATINDQQQQSQDSDSESHISTPSSNVSVSSLVRRPLLRDGGDFSQLFRVRNTQDVQPLVADDLTIFPGKGVLSASHPTAKLHIATKIGVKPRDFIALIMNSDERESTLQKFMVININPTDSVLGKPVTDLPSDANGIPTSIRKCIEYLEAVPQLKEYSVIIFATPAEPSLFQVILKWIDAGESFDQEVLNAANQAANHAGIYAVAEVLIAILKYSPTQLMGPNMKKKNAQNSAEFRNLLNYVCDFINKLNTDDDELLDVFAGVLYDHNDQKAGKNEKRTYLRSLLIMASTRTDEKN